MNTVALVREPFIQPAPLQGERLNDFLKVVERNRFLPVPPRDSIFVGDGDFRTIGLEFLRYFIEIGGLRENDRVLDVGCGIGRMAVPLTQYLDPAAGEYAGVDPAASGIEWCSRNIASHYPNFRFTHIDVSHPLYNPDGCVDGSAIALPFSAGAYDFVIMTSVVTHLPACEIRPYFAEIARLLAPGGRFFISAFVIEDGIELDGDGRDPRLGFEREGQGSAWHANKETPLAAVAFDDGFLDRHLRASGFELAIKQLGRWRGKSDAPNYQDFIVAVKTARGA
ncbi:methyltransferase domain-containing protein [Stappia sp. GBMRC 2046]|uniref:Methyltransferase domain-containing protein n=1 Tax=Stappia sediminis TaxID=2692190 RepID=A0A7X3LSL5_9HYPH|nr:class I SAM-dependent methyltransferase [Stappia sediminis]MXN64355.1 methyltransferase domain-containing protein [Stappia sediminis]